MEATLLNVFTVPADKEEEFLENWRRTSAVFQRGDGLIEAHLHRNTGVGDASFTFINIARWTSADAWRRAHAEYPPTEYDIDGVVGRPAIFAPVADIYGEAHRARAVESTWLSSDR